MKFNTLLSLITAFALCTSFNRVQSHFNGFHIGYTFGHGNGCNNWNRYGGWCHHGCNRWNTYDNWCNNNLEYRWNNGFGWNPIIANDRVVYYVGDQYRPAKTQAQRLHSKKNRKKHIPK